MSDPDAVERLASTQGGCLTRSQALSAGMTHTAVGHRVRTGRWQRLHPGVYVTHNGPVEWLTRCWAALLHAGTDAVLSHRTAAFEQGLVDEQPSVIDVLVADQHRVSHRPGVRLHRSRHLAGRRHPARSLPQTQLEETVLDLVDCSSGEDDVVGWLTRACQRRLSTPARLRDAVLLRRRLRHRELVLAVLEDVRAGVASPLERRYARDVERAHGLPRGRRGGAETVAGRRRYRDVHYEREQVNVELEGLAYHPDDRAGRDDRRDNELVVVGRAVLRYGWGPVAQTPCEVADEVGSVLVARGWVGPLVACSPTCPARQNAGTRQEGSLE